ncbi:MAG: Coenzyme F420 hydrogenase/dehydrogenase, beta subunit C-terminal domain [Syntrophomonadaceae bacterium]
MPGGLELKKEVIKTSSCSLCGACLDWCPYIKNLEDHLVIPFECQQQDGRCYSVCPRTFTDWEAIQSTLFKDMPALEIGPVESIYMAKRGAAIEGQQNGGTVTTLLRIALQQQADTAAIVTGYSNSAIPVPVLVDDVAELNNSMGSRFLSAPSLKKLVEARQRGVKRLITVGRPCQIQALRKAQYKYPEALPEEVIAVGLFCMWSLNWSFLRDFNTEYPGHTIQRIEIPQHGVEIHTDQGTIEVPNDKIRAYIRKGCHYCLDMTSELADISVGAYEIQPEWNTVIVRTAMGRDLLAAASQEELLLKQYPEEELERLKKASYNKKKRNLMVIKEAVDNQGLKPFIDLSQERYQQLLASQEGQVEN